MITYSCMVRALYLRDFSPYFYRNAGMGLIVLCTMAFMVTFYEESFGVRWLIGPVVFMTMELVRLAGTLLRVNELWDRPAFPGTTQESFRHMVVSQWKHETDFKPRFFPKQDPKNKLFF